MTDDEVYEHPRDKEVLLSLTASGYNQLDDAAADDDVDNVKLIVRENDDRPSVTLSLSANPPSFTVAGD